MWQQIRSLFILLALCVGTFAQETAPPPAGPAPQSRTGKIPAGVYRVCGRGTPLPCATQPKAIKQPDPDYSDEARRKKIQGFVVLWLIVGADGHPYDLRVAHSAGYGLDEQTIKTVQTWTFEPGTIDGRPVPVQINVQTTFHIYK